ncbi:50S ribosomal protein L11 methyltransferase [Pontixanthobacter aquaemixtae]|uniref:Methyltransferase domain-containing protein n=1 Tax=Pontixanthobacter aquaemixtae TaxID=1958940 RepID=A0A844ZTE5_9SPHN|nr:50S ribosomal protein L11 methyltransferase [Pontixanthobacter aquaemixtae]MXO91135.1 methyltransferase domain-containing protein [Pontixanthobacter aquaemixtae]
MAQSGKSIFDAPADFLGMAMSLKESGAADQAVKMAKAALAERPDDPELRAVARAILSDGVHTYHQVMLADIPRNVAYRRAIDRFAKGKTILDIGTGTGLLAMMAVRAGAKHVYAVDRNATKADLARDIISANGMSDKITVITKMSLDLDREADLGGGVDMVISELFSANVVGETLMQALAHAAEELTNPGATFVPERCAIMGALAECKARPEVTDVEGFDLSLLNERLKKDTMVSVPRGDKFQRGPAQSLYDCVFEPDKPAPVKDKAFTQLVSDGGTVNGVMQWLRIHFADDIIYENPPGGDPLCHWGIRFEPFDEPRETSQGDRINVGCMQANGELVIWEDS